MKNLRIDSFHFEILRILLRPSILEKKPARLDLVGLKISEFLKNSPESNSLCDSNSISKNQNSSEFNILIKSFGRFLKSNLVDLVDLRILSTISDLRKKILFSKIFFLLSKTFEKIPKILDRKIYFLPSFFFYLSKFYLLNYIFCLLSSNFRVVFSVFYLDSVFVSRLDSRFCLRFLSKFCDLRRGVTRKFASPNVVYT